MKQKQMLFSNILLTASLQFQPVLDSATENQVRKMQSPDHCLYILLPPDRRLDLSA